MIDELDDTEVRFLNRQGLVEGIKSIFKQSKSEIVILVPYIKISDAIWQEMKNAEKKGKHIIIVYRENEMKSVEKDKLYSLPHVTLLNHPHIHTKCYMNEESIIIGSMNLYEHSEVYNREMGVLAHLDSFDTIYEDAKREIREVIKASTIEKKSHLVINNGFKINILTTDEELLRKYLDPINKVFVNKEFAIKPVDEDQTEIICNPYYENMIVYLDYDIYENSEVNIRRARIRLEMTIEKQIELQTRFWSNKERSGLDQFNIYWYKKKDINIYPKNQDYPQLGKMMFDQNIEKLKQGIDLMIDYLRKK